MREKKVSKKKKVIFIVAALILLVVAACYTVFIAPLLKKDEWIYKEAAVERGTLVVGVTESGSLDYGITSVLYDLDLDVSDEDDEEEDDEEEAAQKYLEIEAVYVAPGQRISAEEALLKFTDSSVEAVRRLLQNALVEARNEYNEAETEYKLSLLEAETDYQAKLTSQSYAQSIYGDAKAAVNNSEAAIEAELAQCMENTAALEEKLAEAQTEYAQVQEDYCAAKEGYELYKDTDNISNFMVYQSAYLSALTQYQDAKSAVEQAQRNIEDNADKITTLQLALQAQAEKKNIDALEVEESYKEALLNGENAQITYTAKQEALKAELEEAAEEREALEKKLADFEKFVGEDGTLYAAAEGIVTESAYKAGDSLKQTGVLIAYAEPENMTISVEVAQEDVVELSVGDKVEIEFTSYEGEIYDGSILSIDTTSTAEDSETVSYTAVIGVEGDTTRLYGGMVADITFVTEKKEEVLFVSRKAIVTENGRSYVYKKTLLGGRELTEVQTGISNGVSVEILSGLEEGDSVYIASRVSSETDVKNSDTQAAGDARPETSEELELPEGMELPEGFGGTEGMELPGGMEPDTGRGSGGRTMNGAGRHTGSSGKNGK